MLYYKVVRVRDDGFISFCTRNDCALDYQIGHMTIPEVGGILTFDTLQHALDFMKERDVHKDIIAILEGTGEPMVLPEKRSILLNRHDIEEAWNGGKLAIINQTTWIANTVAVRTFTPHRVVWTGENAGRKKRNCKRKPKEQL